MSAINIGASNADDAFYRYKMPPLQSKIEGRGNGIKTNLVNMVDVAKALARPPSYTTKFFGCELGAQSKFDEKSGTSIVNGAHDPGKLKELLEGFIKRFVQCYACGNPETEVQITKKETIDLQCKACGNISNVDMRHKLTTFILKNPPGGGKAGKAGKADKAMRRAEKERLEAGELVDKAEKAARKEARRLEKERLAKLEAEGGGSEGGEKKEKKSKKDKKEKEEKEGDEEAEDQASSGAEDDEDAADDDDTEWAVDTSAAAQARRAASQLTDASRAMVSVGVKKGEIKAAAAALEKLDVSDSPAETPKSTPAPTPTAADDDEEDIAVDSDEEEEEQELVDGLAEFAAQRPAEQVAAFLGKLPVETDAARLNLLVRATVEGDKLLPELQGQKELWNILCGDAPLMQYALLQALEATLARHQTHAAKELPHMLKYLYDEDIVVEDVILKWATTTRAAKKLKVPKAEALKLRKLAQPIVEWLENASEEEESDEE